MSTDRIVLTLDELSQAFRQSFQIDLWRDPPIKEIANLANPVSTVDELSGRMSAIGRIFDALNKKVFDKHTKSCSKGSRDALIAFLKCSFPNDQPAIEQHIEAPLQCIISVRNHLQHSNRISAKCLAFISLERQQDIHLLPDHAWQNIYARLYDLIDSIQTLIIHTDPPPIHMNETNSALIGELVGHFRRCYAESLRKPLVIPMLREIWIHSPIGDVELARRFRCGISELRALLLPFSDNLIYITPSENGATCLQPHPFFAERFTIDTLAIEGRE
jgi:hypothetical protein